MKKYLRVVLVVIILTPSIALASWWNPISWFASNEVEKPPIVVSSSTSVFSPQTETTKTIAPFLWWNPFSWFRGSVINNDSTKNVPAEQVGQNHPVTISDNATTTNVEGKETPQKDLEKIPPQTKEKVPSQITQEKKPVPAPVNIPPVVVLQNIPVPTTIAPVLPVVPTKIGTAIPQKTAEQIQSEKDFSAAQAESVKETTDATAIIAARQAQLKQEEEEALKKLKISCTWVTSEFILYCVNPFPQAFYIDKITYTGVASPSIKADPRFAARPPYIQFDIREKNGIIQKQIRSEDGKKSWATVYTELPATNYPTFTYFFDVCEGGYGTASCEIQKQMTRDGFNIVWSPIEGHFSDGTHIYDILVAVSQEKNFYSTQ